jgi:hypothetical protein
MAKEPFGFFEFAPAEKLDLDLVGRMIDAARDEVDSVDVVMLPESAVEADDLDALEALLDRRAVALLVTGVRERSPRPGQLPLNWVHLGVNPRLEKVVQPTTSPGERWFHIARTSTIGGRWTKGRSSSTTWRRTSPRRSLVGGDRRSSTDRPFPRAR